MGDGLFSRLRRRFLHQQRGSFMILSVILFLAVILGAAGAVEVSRVMRVQTDAQDALDAAVLAAARRDDPTLPQEPGENFLQAALDARKIRARLSESRFRYDADADRVRGRAALRVGTPLMAIAGRREIMVTVTSEAAPARLPQTEVALVLDVSGSMALPATGSGTDVAPVGSRRIDALSDAVKVLLDTLFEDEDGSGRVRVSVVPYSTSVDVSDYAGKAISGVSITGKGPPLLGARGARGGANAIWAAERHQSGFYTLSDESPAGRRIPFWSALDYGSFGTGSTYFRPVNGILPLTDKRATIDPFIRALEPAGATAGHIGMIWGLYSLSPAWAGIWGGMAPMGYGSGTGRKIIVMMTDGEFNTFFRPSAVSGDATTHSYAYFQSACRLAESRGVTIFTVAFQAPPLAATQLTTCATPDGGAFSPRNRAELIEAFKAIGMQSAFLRLTG